jgi:hypothetical protein
MANLKSLETSDALVERWLFEPFGFDRNRLLSSVTDFWKGKISIFWKLQLNFKNFLGDAGSLLTDYAAYTDKDVHHFRWRYYCYATVQEIGWVSRINRCSSDNLGYTQHLSSTLLVSIVAPTIRYVLLVIASKMHMENVEEIRILVDNGH